MPKLSKDPKRPFFVRKTVFGKTYTIANGENGEDSYYWNNKTRTISSNFASGVGTQYLTLEKAEAVFYAAKITGELP